MSPIAAANMGGQFGDTTYTKLFVGGLAWETQRDTMKSYFEQFGEILEAVVNTDKATGRSKGYGFVTFREAEEAMKACVDPAPVIDGRRANCNLASLGVQRTRPTTPQHGGSRNFRAMNKSSSYHINGAAGLQSGGMGAAFAAAATFPNYAAVQQAGFPYSLYGYAPYSADYSTYPMSYYNAYGGTAMQFPVYGGANIAGITAAGNTSFYPYYQFGQSAGGTGPAYTQGQSYGLQYPAQMFQYSAMSSAAGITGFAAQHYGAPISPPSAQPAGMTMALPAAPTHLPTPASHHYRLIPPLTASAAREQPLA